MTVASRSDVVPGLAVNAVRDISNQPLHPAGHSHDHAGWEPVAVADHPPYGSSRTASYCIRLNAAPERAWAACRCARNTTLEVRNVNGAWTAVLNVAGTGPDPAMKLGATGSAPAIYLHSHTGRKRVWLAAVAVYARAPGVPWEAQNWTVSPAFSRSRREMTVPVPLALARANTLPPHAMVPPLTCSPAQTLIWVALEARLNCP